MSLASNVLKTFALSAMALAATSCGGDDPQPNPGPGTGPSEIKTETLVSAPTQTLVIRTDSTAELVNLGITQAYRIGLSLKSNAVGVKGSMTYTGDGIQDIKDVRNAGGGSGQMVYFNSANHNYQIKRNDDKALFTADDKSVAYKSFKSSTLIFQEALVEGATDQAEARKWAELWTKNADKVTITSKSNGVVGKATLNDKMFTLNGQ